MNYRLSWNQKLGSVSLLCVAVVQSGIRKSLSATVSPVVSSTGSISSGAHDSRKLRRSRGKRNSRMSINSLDIDKDVVYDRIPRRFVFLFCGK